MKDRLFQKHCPINERTADGISVGRCYHFLGKGGKTCPRHGDVSEAVEKFLATGELTPEKLSARTLFDAVRYGPGHDTE